jgi:lipopolysaccharide transport system ATP-binding protein
MIEENLVMGNENRAIAVKVSGVKKQYKLGQIGGGSLQADIQSWWARVRGKEDPNVKIGEERLIGQTFMALNGVDLTIYQGEAVGIIGGNGAGKSTLLKLLSRVTAPTKGEIDIYGRITSMLEVGTGFNGEMTGRENVYLNGAILGMTKAEIDAKMEEIIEFSEVRDFIDAPVKRYSSGMYVKLAFSVAAHLDSEIMIMDEVLAVGDMAFQKKCLDKMRDAAKKEGRTVLYVSHNMNTIRQLCDRCIVLDKGKVVFMGDVDKAISVYMKQNFDSKISYKYDKNNHALNESGIFQFLGLDILDREKNQVVSGEDLKFVFHCIANKDIEKIKFRFEIFFSDATIVGASFSDGEIAEKEGSVFDVYMQLSTGNFPAGKYYVAALAFEYDNFGNQVPIDYVEPALSFEVIDKEGSIVWLHQYWGHVRLDDMSIKKVVKTNN